MTDDPEVAYSIFLQFMNSVRAYRAKKIMDIKEFCPGWKKSLLCELKTNAQLFREASEPHHFSTTLHNLAYVHQVLAEEHEKTERFDIANREYLHAYKMYENAKVIRERLRDPRRIAQSNVRIAECKLGLARCALINACEFMEEATKLANEVDEHYRKIPQEKFREEDLQNIRNWIIRLKNKVCID